MSDERRPDLDRAIDAALREMAGAEGPADMRRRVLARLEEPPRGTRVRWPALGAAAAAAVVVIAIAVMRAGTPPPERPAPVARASAPAAPVASAAPAGEAPALAAAPRVRTAGHDVPAARRRPAERPPAEAERYADTEMTVDPIELAPLSMAPIGKDARIAVAALANDRLEIAPLAEPEP